MGELSPTSIFLGLGSNLGDRRANFQGALTLLASRLTITQVSSLYETEPVGYLDQPRFLNAVCQATTTAGPETVLAWAKETEAALGRTPSARYGPRTVDVDLLLYGSLVLATPSLVIPHPRLAERAFVLAPLAEIAPSAVHPVLKQTATVLLDAVAGREGVKLVEGQGWWEASRG